MPDDDERQQLLAMIAQRDATIARQAAEILILKQTVDALCRRIFGKSSEKLDSAQLELLLGGDLAKKAPAALPADPGPAAEIPNHKKRAKKTRAPRIPEHLPIIRQELDPPEVLLNPEAFRRIGEEVREQLHFKPAEFIRIQLVRGKFVRKDDATAKPFIQPLPPSLQDRCIATPGLIAEVLDNRFTCHLPYYRQAEMFARMGVEIHRKTLCDWTLLAADWLSIIYREIQYEHWRCPYRQIDETPIRYLKPGSGKAKIGYLWTSNIPGGTVFYHWHDGRDAHGMDGLFEQIQASDPQSSIPPKHFRELQCILQCDGYAVYPSWSKDKPWIRLMGCHSHMRRKFFEATDQSPRLVAWILRQLAHLYQIEKRLRETQAGPALRQAVRAAESSLIHRRLKKAIDKLALRRTILPKSKLGKAISYAINQWPKLAVYLEDGRVEICNNLVENAIRPTKLGAKNWLFIGNEMSGEKCAIHYTIVENCRRLGINPKQYLTDVLTRLPGMLAKDAHTLTPANWLKSRNGKPERMVA